MSKYIFPSILIILNICAAVVCFWNKEYKTGVYWMAAAILNFCVTF